MKLIWSREVRLQLAGRGVETARQLVSFYEVTDPFWAGNFLPKDSGLANDRVGEKQIKLNQVPFACNMTCWREQLLGWHTWQSL
jgi:hypothetical protein